ncbi:hypothetical protein QQP08_006683 [Theobroma cacao]|nr:hypothetical protein QQP08_006683 [Theobroma cacao]
MLNTKTTEPYLQVRPLTPSTPPSQASPSSQRLTIFHVELVPVPIGRARLPYVVKDVININQCFHNLMTITIVYVK